MFLLQKSAQGTIIIKISTMWLTRREKGLCVTTRSNQRGYLKRRGDLLGKEEDSRRAHVQTSKSAVRGSKSLGHYTIPLEPGIFISLTRLLHHRPPPRPGRRGGAPTSATQPSIRAIHHHHSPAQPRAIHHSISPAPPTSAATRAIRQTSVWLPARLSPSLAAPLLFPTPKTAAASSLHIPAAALLVPEPPAANALC